MVVILIGAIRAVAFIGEDERECPKQKQHGQRNRGDDPPAR